MNRTFRPTSSRWAVMLLSAAALVLGACGRKGPLELPPTASPTPTASAAAPAANDTQSEAAPKGTLFNSSYGTDAPPLAPKGEKRSFFLDPLLGPGPDAPGH